MNSGKALHLLRQAAKGEEQWVRDGILSEAACRLVGAEMRALLQGRRALVLRQGRVEIIELPETGN